MKVELWSDADLLEAMALTDQGWTRKAIGERIGRSKNSVIGTLHRIQNEQIEGSAGDNTMPSEWWRDGLAKR